MRLFHITIALLNLCHLYSSDAAISPIVEGGKCVGIKITSEIGFKYTTLPFAIRIVEAFHGKEIRGQFDLALNDNGSTIVLKSKPGLVDYLTGNSIVVTIDKSAINGGERTMELKYKNDIKVK